MKLRLCASGVAALSAAILFSTAETANAQQSASAAAFLEEVVVTARRREENLEELPLSIQAISRGCHAGPGHLQHGADQ